MIKRFADTSYYLALVNPDDEAHEAATDLTLHFAGTLITTTWVLTELGDALADPVNRQLFLEMVGEVQSDRRVLIPAPTRQLLDRGVDFYRKRPDKGWSLTDCISFVIMQDHGIAEALTADHHFEQAGFRALLK